MFSQAQKTWVFRLGRLCEEGEEDGKEEEGEDWRGERRRR